MYIHIMSYLLLMSSTAEFDINLYDYTVAILGVHFAMHIYVIAMYMYHIFYTIMQPIAIFCLHYTVTYIFFFFLSCVS